MITLTMTREEAMMLCNLLLYFGEIATNLEVRPQIQDTLNGMNDREILVTGVGVELYERLGFRLKKEIEKQK